MLSMISFRYYIFFQTSKKDPENPFFEGFESLAMPTYFGTIALFVFGILSSKEGATTCFIMLPMLIGSKGRIVVYGLMMRNFVEGRLK